MTAYERVVRFYARYRGEKRVIGYSVLGRSIYAFFVGEHGKEGIVQGGIHAREWVTALLVLKLIGRKVRGGVWYVPLVNPDGAELCQRGARSVEALYLRRDLLQINGGADFSQWKANARAVDLNVNFPARWGTGRSNVFSPAPSSYVGEAPFSEPETRALAAFTLSVRPTFTLSYHAKGEVIYWRFYQEKADEQRDLSLAQRLSEATGYALSDGVSAGGYKDWCTEKLGVPSFTIEIGKEAWAHPIGASRVGKLYRKNKDGVRALCECRNV